MAAPNIDLVKDLVRTAAAVRRFLEPRWPAYREAIGFTKGEAPSAATCLITTKFLQAAFADRGMDSECLFGRAEEGRGYFNGEGWSNHAWLRISGFDLDCTGDQFGKKPVSINLAGRDPNYQAANRTYDFNDDKIAREFLERWRQEWKPAAPVANVTLSPPPAQTTYTRPLRM